MGFDECSHFDQIRIQNRRIVRNLMRHFPKLGKAELADISGLSFPTVSALLSDLVQSGEVLILPGSASRGGRPAEQFALNPLFQTAVCAYLENFKLFVRVNDVLGNSLIEYQIPVTRENCDKQIESEMLSLKGRYPSLSIVCLGIPGVIVDGQITYLPDYPTLDGLKLQSILEKDLSVPVRIENDVNVFVFAEREKWPDLVHIFRSFNCVGAGILINSTIISGFSGCAGEVEYIPLEQGEQPVTFGEKLVQISKEYPEKTDADVSVNANADANANANARKAALISVVARVSASIISIINPPDIALSGFELDDADIPALQAGLEKIIPKSRCPDFHIVDAIDDLYQSGLLMIAMDYWKSK